MAQVRPLAVRKSFSAPGYGRYFEGQLVRSDDPVVKGKEELFADVLDELGIEQATKNPGQKRAAKKPKPAAEPTQTVDEEPEDGL